MSKESLHNQTNSLKASLARLADLPLSEEAHAAVMEASEHANELEKVLHGEVEELYFQVEQTQTTKNKFVSVVTHELRLPLTSIRGYTDLLRGGMIGPLNEQQINFLNVIHTNVERMTTLIADLSDISHLETGRLKFAYQPTLFRVAVDEALTHWQAKMEEKGLTVEIDIPANLPAVQTDNIRLVQVLGYLLSNAYKYTPTGGKISIRCLLEDQVVRVEVVDTGIGISAADQARLFQQFFRSEDEAVREFPGWGLALHLGKRLIEAMGGHMGVTSALKQGSTFWFTLPVRRDDETKETGS